MSGVKFLLDTNIEELGSDPNCFFTFKEPSGSLNVCGGMVLIFRGLDAMVVMRSAWVLAMLAVTVLALLPVEHLQLPVLNWWVMAPIAG